MHSKMMRYDRVIRRLNEFRKEGFAFGLVSALGEASIGSSAGDSVRGYGDEHYFPGRELTLMTVLRSARLRRPRRGGSCRTSFANVTSSTANSSARLCRSGSTRRATCLRTRRAKTPSRFAR